MWKLIIVVHEQYDYGYFNQFFVFYTISKLAPMSMCYVSFFPREQIPLFPCRSTSSRINSNPPPPRASMAFSLPLLEYLPSLPCHVQAPLRAGTAGRNLSGGPTGFEWGPIDDCGMHPYTATFLPACLGIPVGSICVLPSLPEF